MAWYAWYVVHRPPGRKPQLTCPRTPSSAYDPNTSSRLGVAFAVISSYCASSTELLIHRSAVVVGKAYKWLWSNACVKLMMGEKETCESCGPFSGFHSKRQDCKAISTKKTTCFFQRLYHQVMSFLHMYADHISSPTPPSNQPRFFGQDSPPLSPFVLGKENVEISQLCRFSSQKEEAFWKRLSVSLVRTSGQKPKRTFT